MMTLSEIAAAEARAKAEIQHCPWCKQNAVVLEIQGRWYVECENDDCVIRPSIQSAGYNKEETIETWNKCKDTDVSRLAATARTAIEQRDAAVELLAEKIYESWSDQQGYVPWTNRGNSLKQDEARRQARCGLDAFLAQVGKGGA